MKNIAFSTVVLLALFDPAHAARTLVVATDGSGDYKKVTAAEKDAEPGDTILIRDGSDPWKLGWRKKKKDKNRYWLDWARGKSKYLEAVLKPGIRYQAESGFRMPPFLIVQSSSATLAGFEFETTAITESRNVTLESFRVTGAGQGISIASAQGILLRRCRIEKCGVGIRVEAGDGVYLPPTSRLTVEDCVLAENSSAVRIEDAEKGGGPHRWISVLGNTFTRNGKWVKSGTDLFSDVYSNMTGGIVLNTNSPYLKLRVERNIFAFNANGMIADFGKHGMNIKVDFNKNLFFKNQRFDFAGLKQERKYIYPNTTDEAIAAIQDEHERRIAKLTQGAMCVTLDCGPETIKEELDILDKSSSLRGSVAADPMFLDPEKGDYRLSEHSPARRAGIGAPDPRAEDGASGLPADRPTSSLSSPESQSCANAPGVLVQAPHGEQGERVEIKFFMPPTCCESIIRLGMVDLEYEDESELLKESLEHRTRFEQALLPMRLSDGRTLRQVLDGSPNARSRLREGLRGPTIYNTGLICTASYGYGKKIGRAPGSSFRSSYSVPWELADLPEHPEGEPMVTTSARGVAPVKVSMKVGEALAIVGSEEKEIADCDFVGIYPKTTPPNSHRAAAGAGGYRTRRGRKIDRVRFLSPGEYEIRATCEGKKSRYPKKLPRAAISVK